MKNYLKKIVTTALVMVMLVCSMAACGKSLSGSYESEIEVLGQSWNVTYTFKGKNVEAVSKVTILGNVQNTTSTGTYELVENADGTMEITIDFENETDLFKDGTFTFEEAEEYIKIGKSQYNKITK
ncbi:MAG: hypothetical protein J6K15_01760 [Lachnospiraceae bacterium]|nr:hypothetical protein [Lachnospiraceae bacterium]